jgi:hypothetical protein
VPASGSFFPVGTTLVVCTATDDSGNPGRCSFNVTVTDVPVVLSINRSGANVILRWPITCGTFILEQTTSLSAPIAWTPVGVPVSVVSGQYQVTLPATGMQRYFRLRQ